MIINQSTPINSKTWFTYYQPWSSRLT